MNGITTWDYQHHIAIVAIGALTLIKNLYRVEVKRSSVLFLRCEELKLKKYKNKVIIVSGNKFDSQKEAQHYLHLRALEVTQRIYDLQLQPEFILVDGFIHEGKKIRDIKYIADFSYRISGKPNTLIVEDVKSSYTAKLPVFMLKKKLFWKRYPWHKLIEVL